MSGAAKLMIPVGFEERLRLAAFVSGTQSGPDDGAAYILFLDSHAVIHGPRRPTQPTKGSLYLRFDEPALAQVFFIAIFGAERKTCIIRMTADAIMGDQFISQAVQAQRQVEVGPVFADPRIIQPQRVAVRIAPSAEVGRLAVGIAETDAW